MTRTKPTISFDQSNPLSKSRTIQSFKNETDINKIVQRARKTGVLGDPNRPSGTFGDFTGISDFQLICDTVLRAQRRFQELPSEIRSKFDNSPTKLVEFINDPKNLEEAQKLGLLPKEPEKEIPPPNAPTTEPNPQPEAA